MSRGRHSTSATSPGGDRACPARRRPVGLVVLSVVLLAVAGLLLPFTGGGEAAAGTSAAAAAVTKSVTTTRVHVDLASGNDVPVDSRDVSVTVHQTTDLRDRQAVSVTWTGAHPTGGIYNDQTAIKAAQEEYPVVIMQCRGMDSASVPAAQRIRPETCWTQSTGERSQSSEINPFPPIRVDRFAEPAARGLKVGVPNPLPASCAGNDAGLQYWLHFVAADGTDFGGGPKGCAGMPPEAVNVSTSFQPSNTTYGATGTDGTGSTSFIINTVESNASLGCSDKVACSIVVVPIIGVSCDAGGTLLPPDDRTPTAFAVRADRECRATGHYQPGELGDGSGVQQTAVSGELWYAASNWRNHLSFPLSFAPAANVCDLVSSSKPTYLYGSQLMQQATQQWAPAFCLDPKKFRFQHVQFSEPGSRNLLVSGSVEAALVASPPETAYEKPVVQAPLALTGFAIAYRLDDAQGREVTTVRLTPRLLAKLMTMSYTATIGVKIGYKYVDGSTTTNPLENNPTDIVQDPEFRALNPNAMEYINGYDTISASTLFSVSSDSDVIAALTSYIDADPEARAWLDGAADPWGMRVNPNYKGLVLPVNSWPVLETFVSDLSAQGNPCLALSPVPYLPLVAAPVSNPATVTLNMQFQNSNSTVSCKDAGDPNQKLVGLGRQITGRRALFGLVALADARRYDLPTASLLSHTDSAASAKFTDSTGRTFVGPTDDGLKTAASLLKEDKAAGTWPIPYTDLRGDSGKAAYPGTMLVSLDVPTRGLPAADAARYAQLIAWATTTGQTPGTGIGQLPSGYLPLTAANGLGALTSYAAVAAAAVKAQQGYVPAVDGSSTPPPAPSPLPSTGDPGTTGGGDPGTGGGGDGGGGVPTSAEPSAAPTPTPSASPTTIALVRTADTVAINAGPLANAIPVLLVLSLVSGAAALTTLLWRRA